MQINIIGAGIGGLTTAIALHRKGFKIKVFDAAPALRPLGAGIVMASNAMQVFRRLGCADAVYARGNELSAMHIADHRRRSLQCIDIRWVKAQFGEPSVSIHRGALQQVLLEYLPEGIVFTGKRLKNLTQDASGVSAFFEDGSSERSDLLIGADGLRSATRQAIFGAQALRYSTHTCWRGMLELQLDEPELVYECWGSEGGMRVALVQVSPGKVYFYYTEKQNAGFQTPGGDHRAYLQQRLRAFPALYAEAIGSADNQDIFHDDLYDLTRLDQWHKGRVLLLGDAAHATTPNLGQGACQAVEDAWFLAEHLAAQAGNAPEQIFSQYEKSRRAKTDYVVNTSYRIGLLSNLGGPLGYRLRNALLKSTPESINRKQVSRIFKVF